MGTIKFYNGGQAMTEAMLFGLAEFDYLRDNFSLSVYPPDTYTNKELTTLMSPVRNVPHFNYESSYNTTLNSILRRFGFPMQGGTTNVYAAMFGSTDTAHDKTLSTFHNAVASVSCLTEATYNGVKTLVISLTNLDSSNSVTVCSIQRSSYGQFKQYPRESQSSYGYYLDWAYYFDEDEYITLEPGGTKTVILSFTLSDLTA